MTTYGEDSQQGSSTKEPDLAKAIAERAWEIRFASMLTRKAPLTRILIFLIVGVHLVVSLYAQEAWLGAGSGDGMADYAALSLVGANEHVLIDNGEWWRLISCVFLHAGLLHLIFNAMALHYLGRIVENALGPGPFLLVFLLGGWFASFCSYELTAAMSVGASGAVFALLGAAASYGLVNRSRIPKRLKRFLVVTPLVWIALNGVLTFVIPNIDVAAHGGGLIVGVVLTPLLGDQILLRRPKLPAPLLRLIVIATSLFSMLTLVGFMVPRFLGNPERANVYLDLSTEDFLGQPVAVPEGWNCSLIGHERTKYTMNLHGHPDQRSETKHILVCQGPYATEFQVERVDLPEVDASIGRQVPDWSPVQVLTKGAGVDVPKGRAVLALINRRTKMIYRLVTFEALIENFYPLMERVQERPN